MAGRAPLNIEGCQQVYPWAIERARWAAKLCGYAIGVHGSMTYDLDLIAVPWAVDAAPAAVLAEVVAWATDTWITARGGDPRFAPKPHGRLCWQMFWIGRDDDIYDHLHIDLSIFAPERIEHAVEAVQAVVMPVLVPHTPDWFAALEKANPGQAAHTRIMVRRSGTDGCSVCGDKPARDYTLDVDPPPVPSTLRLCSDCVGMRTRMGEKWVLLAV